MQTSSIAKFSALLLSIYGSKQFIKYIICGAISSAVHIIARWAFNQYMDFGLAVFLSYFVGMPVALFLYRIFVFNGREGSVTRQFLLFSLTYFGFLPVTWLLSVAAEPPLAAVLPMGQAELFAHMIGVVAPVVINFAYNKFITFGERLPTSAVPDRRS
jgi:putative flippase GtrA